MVKSKILVPVDFQSQSVFALEYASKVATSINAKISCLYVIEEPGFITGQHITKEIREKIRRDAEMKLAEVANKVLKHVNIPYEIIVSKGKVYKQIAETAKDLSASFIVMGKTDSSKIKKNLTGTNAYHLISESTLPVITVRNTNYSSDGHLLLPLDLTKPIGAKLEKAIEFATMLNAKVSVITICSKTGNNSIRKKFEKKLTEIKKIFSNQHLVCQTKFIETNDSVPQAINHFAKINNTELILLMTQKEKGFIDSFVGSTAHEVVGTSEIPVLSIIPNVKRDKILLDETLFTHITDPVNFICT